MPDATAALQSLPFSSLIGGPLDAAIKAQAQAAIATVGFIRDVGVDKDGNVSNITFTVKKGQNQTVLSVPLLTIVPIPFLRIDNMTIAFKAHITASEEKEDATSSSIVASASLGGSVNYLVYSAKIDASFSTKKDSTSTATSRYSIEHTVDVNVHAVQDDIPGGLARLLGILEKTIEEPPEGPPAPKP